MYTDGYTCTLATYFIKLPSLPNLDELGSTGSAKFS